MVRKRLTGLFSVFTIIVFIVTFLSPDISRLSPPSTPTAIFHKPHPRQNLVIREQFDPAASRQPPLSDSVLLPDWEVLLLLPPSHHFRTDSRLPSCLFHNGAVSPANYSGFLPTANRHTFRCTLPSSVRRLRPFYSPRLIPPTASGHIHSISTSPPPAEMLQWNLMAYESFSTADDVILFAKGVNTRKGDNRPPADLRCVFYSPGDFTAAVRTAVTISAQEVFRCPHPARSETGLRISLEIGDGRAIPSLAHYRPRAPLAAQDKGPPRGKSLMCACTMVYNVAKFLREWVVYHSRIGVERFLIYDNGSDDELDRVVASLNREGYNVSTLLWPWPKTQEAGFSHCAITSRDSCTWMMFLDVDEFVFSPQWANSSNPSPQMLSSLLLPIPNRGRQSPPPIGQLSMSCYEFGPSGQKANPVAGVTQGYTCRRRRMQRHKSIVLVEAVEESLVNSVHHFRVRGGYGVRRVGRREGVVNHYKYQAWAEFKGKFRRRVSAYVVDWRREVNRESKDRAPGLGYVAVEPSGWAEMFCEVTDTGLRDASRRWFGEAGPATGEYRMVWQETDQ